MAKPTTTHFRGIGNPKEHKGPALPSTMVQPPTGMTKHQRGGPCNYGTGVDPRAGVSGSSKSRRHFPVAQAAQLCTWALWRPAEREIPSPEPGGYVRCKNVDKKCDKCWKFDKYKPQYRKTKPK